MAKRTTYNFAERIMLQHSYLPKLALDCIGIALGGVLFWQRQIWWALVALIGLSILGNVVAWRQDIYKLAKTRLGKWMLYQAKPVNLVVRTIGAGVVAYGLWLHSAWVIVAGVAVVFLGRFLSKK